MTGWTLCWHVNTCMWCGCTKNCFGRENCRERRWINVFNLATAVTNYFLACVCNNFTGKQIERGNTNLYNICIMRQTNYKDCKENSCRHTNCFNKTIPECNNHFHIYSSWCSHILPDFCDVTDRKHGGDNGLRALKSLSDVSVRLPSGVWTSPLLSSGPHYSNYRLIGKQLPTCCSRVKRK